VAAAVERMTVITSAAGNAVIEEKDFASVPRSSSAFVAAAAAAAAPLSEAASSKAHICAQCAVEAFSTQEELKQHQLVAHFTETKPRVESSDDKFRLARVLHKEAIREAGEEELQEKQRECAAFWAWDASLPPEKSPYQSVSSRSAPARGRNGGRLWYSDEYCQAADTWKEEYHASVVTRNAAAGIRSWQAKLEKAIQLYKEAAENEHSGAIINLACLLVDEQRPPRILHEDRVDWLKRRLEALKLLTRPSVASNKVAQFNHGALLQVREEEEPLWSTLYEEQGNAEGGKFPEFFFSGPEREALMVQLFQKSAAQNFALAHTRLGLIAEERSTAQVNHEGAGWNHIEAGSEGAYWNGFYTKAGSKTAMQALVHYEEAAKHQDPYAHYRLGQLAYWRSNAEAALPHFRQAAILELPHAHCQVAHLLTRSRGNWSAKIEEEYRRAAAQYHTPSMRYLLRVLGQRDGRKLSQQHKMEREKYRQLLSSLVSFQEHCRRSMPPDPLPPFIPSLCPPLLPMYHYVEDITL
jgi:TPR repeat protein